MTRVTVATLLLLASCSISAHYDRDSREEPISVEQTSPLVPGRSELSACLQQLGAPTDVWECREDCVAIAYGWQDQAGWGFSAGFVFRGGASASYRWDSVALDVPGVVLLFDESLKLTQLRRGKLIEIAKELRKPKRPTTIDEG